jgi:hypothetical protein
VPGLLHRHISWIVPVLELSLVSAVIAYVAGIAAARRLGSQASLVRRHGRGVLAGVILVRVDETKRSALTG